MSLAYAMPQPSKLSTLRACQAEGCRILNTYPQRFKALVAEGRIRAYTVPGFRTMYSLADILAIAESATRSEYRAH